VIISTQSRAQAHDEAHLPQSHHMQMFVILLTEERRGDMQGEKPSGVSRSNEREGVRGFKSHPRRFPTNPLQCQALGDIVSFGLWMNK